MPIVLDFAGKTLSVEQVLSKCELAEFFSGIDSGDADFFSRGQFDA
jgi:hypothetical protein